MGTTLTGKLIADTYDALLKVTDNNVITGIKKRMTDGFGNDTPLLISTTDVQVDGNFLTESVQFNTTTLQTADTVGKLAWNDNDGTLDLRLKGGNVTLQVGQEQVIRAVNKTGTNLLEANYQVVRVDGAQGNRLKIALAQANNDANSAETLGLVTETINDNQEGFITTSGIVRGINTTGSLQGETWADGDMLYLSGTIAGRLTKVKPTAPIHTVIMGYVVRAHATQGQIFVKVDNGYELDELHNVLITSPLNNQALVYESATGLWKNQTIATGVTSFNTRTGAITLTSGDVTGALGYTPYNATNPAGYISGITRTQVINALATGGSPFEFLKSDGSVDTNLYVQFSRTITINGVTQDLSANRTFNIPAISSLNGLTGATQTFATGTSGADFNISSVGSVHTFNIPTASSSTRGLLSAADWVIFANRISGSGTTNFVPKFNGATSLANSLIFDNGTNVGIGTTTFAYPSSGRTILGINGVSSSLIEFGVNGTTNGYINNTSEKLEIATANFLALLSGNTERIRITSAGNVGINTTTPSELFEVQRNQNATTRLLISNSDTTNTASRASIRTNSNGVIGEMVSINSLGVYLGAASNHELSLMTNGSQRIVITSAGNVGIGTSSPSNFSGYTTLDIYNGTNGGNLVVRSPNVTAEYLVDEPTPGAYIGTRTSHPLIFRTALAERMRITSGGNVGIGTSSPQNLLHVSANNGTLIKIQGSSTGANTNSYQAINGNGDIMELGIANAGYASGSYPTILARGSYLYGQNGLGLIAEAFPIMFQTSNTERMRITSAGNVGIGTTSPDQRLTIGSGNGISIRTVSGGTYGSLRFGTNESTWFDAWAGIDSDWEATGVNVANLRFYTSFGSRSERMRITSGGNVLIGTTSGTGIGRMELVIGGNSLGSLISLGNSTNANRAQIVSDSGENMLIVNRASTPMILYTADTERMRITSGGSALIGTTTNPYDTARLVVSNDSSFPRNYFQRGVNLIEIVPSDGTSPNIISSSYTAAGSAYMPLSISARQNNSDLYLTTGGNVGVGTTSVSSVIKLQVEGRFAVNTISGNVSGTNCTASFRAITGTAADRVLEAYSIGYSALFYLQNNGSYFFAGSNLSDARAKKDITYFNEPILDKLMQLKPASFRYTQNDENVKGGFIAQDVKEIFPDLVTKTKDEDDLMGVDYYGVIALLTKAIQEQQEQINELKARLK